MRNNDIFSLHETAWHMTVINHIAGCRAEWLSLVKSEPQRGLENLEEADLADY